MRMNNNEQPEEYDNPLRIIPEDRLEFYSTGVSKHPDDLVTDEDVNLPDYERPFNYRYGEVEDGQEIDPIDETEEGQSNG